MGSCRDRTSKRVKKVRLCFRLKLSLYCGSLYKLRFLGIALFIIPRFKEKIYCYREIELVIEISLACHILQWLKVLLISRYLLIHFKNMHTAMYYRNYT